MVKVLACSARVVEKGMGPPLRGLVHSAFASAANIIFPDGFLLSLNASSSSPNHPTPQRKYYENEGIQAKNLKNFSPVFPHSREKKSYSDHFGRGKNHSGHFGEEENYSAHFSEEESYADSSMMIKNFPNFLSSLNYLHNQEEAGLLMPNGVLLDVMAGEFPFAGLRVGMPVIWGAGRLVLDAVACVLDFADCPRWNPRIERPVDLDMGLVKANGLWLAQLCQREGLNGMLGFEGLMDEPMPALAERLCGRGRGLTPGGDDFLAGWMAAGWLLTGPQPDFLTICQQICRIARTRTHALSQCWLEYAANGDVALPISEVLMALTKPDLDRLEHAARGLLALGATSGLDVLQGILYYLLKDEMC